MTAPELLGALLKQGYRLAVVDGQIKISPIRRLPAELRAEIQRQRKELLDLVRTYSTQLGGLDALSQGKPAKWQPGDRPTNKFQALRDLYGDDPEQW